VYLHSSVYIKTAMRYSFDPKKKAGNLKKHGLDFDDGQGVIESTQTVTFEDNRFDYGEARYITLGLLHGKVVIICHGRNRQNHTHHFHAKGRQT